jgi:hypothetical protein
LRNLIKEGEAKAEILWGFFGRRANGVVLPGNLIQEVGKTSCWSRRTTRIFQELVQEPTAMVAAGMMLAMDTVLPVNQPRARLMAAAREGTATSKGTDILAMPSTRSPTWKVRPEPEIIESRMAAASSAGLGY